MSNRNTNNLGCRHCRYYRPEGQRGGQCQMLGVPVRGIWSACTLVVPPFAPSWEAPTQDIRRQAQRLQTHTHPLLQAKALHQVGPQLTQQDKQISCVSSLLPSPLPSESPQTVTAS